MGSMYEKRSNGKRMEEFKLMRCQDSMLLLRLLQQLKETNIHVMDIAQKASLHLHFLLWL